MKVGGRSRWRIEREELRAYEQFHKGDARPTHQDQGMVSQQCGPKFPLAGAREGSRQEAVGERGRPAGGPFWLAVKADPVGPVH